MTEGYIFYADVFFLQNFIMKFGVLLFIYEIIKVHIVRPRIKSMVIAAIATISEILGLFLCPNYNLLLSIACLIEVPLMVFVLLGFQKNYLLRGIVLGYLGTLVMNGVIELLWNYLGTVWWYPSLVLAAVIGSLWGIKWAYTYIKMQKGIYRIELQKGDQSYVGRGFFDSGNSLKDPLTQKGVHIIRKSVAVHLGFAEGECVCIPFQSLGQEHGLIPLFYVDKVSIMRPEGTVIQEKSAFAVASDSLFTGKYYEIILNKEVW